MPEKGWAILTVRVATAATAKGLARRMGATVDEYINSLIESPMEASRGADWIACNICGGKVNSANLSAHKARAHRQQH